MLKLVAALTLVLSPLALVTTPQAASAEAGPDHTLQVSGTGVGMYPAYDASVRRYAATTTEDTFPSDATDNTTNQGASITVQATTSDPDGTVLVNGVPLDGGQTTLTGLDAGDEVSVIYVDSAGREADSVFLLPADFPTLSTTISQPGITSGQVGLTLSQWTANGWPLFDTVLDQNGVPSWVRASHDGGIDLKRQPNGSFSEARPTSTPGLTGSDIVEMNSRFQVIATHHTVGMTNTDAHDSILEADGSEVLLAYVPNAATGKIDSVFQELDPQGNKVFQWDSSALADETVAGTNADYAHINSVQIVDNGQDYLVSFRHLSAVLLIDRQPHDGDSPGDIIWKLGGRDSSFSFVDDPYDGPCAQHSASMLPNGDIMVFDNGSVTGFGAFCVDQSDPSGPVHDRPQSRLAVWHLDQAAGTATLVRSYAPPSWFGFFMGSAQYLPQTGNILVGWASGVQGHALATELSPDNTPIWQLEATPSSNGKPYFSYRSLKFDAPDTIDPDVTVTSPGDGASYAYGEHVTADFSCTDTGGSSLQTCGDVLPGTALDTTVPGSHSFTVTAEDGAGNTTTVVRDYTVGSQPTFRPDVSVRRADGHWLGADVFGTAAAQTADRKVAAGSALTVPFRLTNRGNRSDRCLVSGTKGTKTVAATFRFEGTDVTRRVLAGTWRTPSTGPGARHVLRLRLRVADAAERGLARTFRVRCASVHAAGVTDAAAVRVTVR
jgi:hypothetical protein